MGPMKWMAGFGVFIFFALLFASCVEHSPFYGTWADNKGNQFSFFSDGSFTARAGSTSSKVDTDGNYSILRNVLTLNCTSIGTRVVTEWDIRGNILYIIWTSLEGESTSLSLYKISN